MANIASWLGTQAHNKLLVGGSYGAASHMIGGAVAGAGFGVASSVYNGTGTPISDAIDTGIKGAVLGAGTRFASAKYSEGAFRSTVANTMGYSTPELAKRNSALSAQSHNFSISNFTNSQNTSYWNVNQTASDNLASANFMSRYRG